MINGSAPHNDLIVMLLLKYLQLMVILQRKPNQQSILFSMRFDAASSHFQFIPKIRFHASPLHLNCLFSFIVIIRMHFRISIVMLVFIPCFALSSQNFISQSFSLNESKTDETNDTEKPNCDELCEVAVMTNSKAIKKQKQKNKNTRQCLSSITPIIFNIFKLY